MSEDNTEAGQHPEDVEAPTAAERLRAFEDEALGADAPRISGRLERGSGSLYLRMTAEQRAQHAKLEKFAEAELQLETARASLAAAEAAYAAAVATIEEHTDAVGHDGPVASVQ